VRADARRRPRRPTAEKAHARVRQALLDWYDANARPLPWRRRPNPYRIWVAEIMLQQTRISVVEPAYRLFLRSFPTLVSLATANEEDVLSLWSGLGYYSRARSLHRAARLLHERGEKTFPRTWTEAMSLPGVGAYTAAAVLSIAYGQPRAAVDGNVIRVLSRLECLGLPDGRGEPHASLAGDLLARDRPGDWNQAMMELGETLCLPRAPRCDVCPVRRLCTAHARGVVEQHPPPKPRRATQRLGLSVMVLRDPRGRLLLERGAFEHLDHLWLPPVRKLRTPPRRVDFKHAILHRSFEVKVEGRTVPAAELRRLAARPSTEGAERRVVPPEELATLGRSSLLTKALLHARDLRARQKISMPRSRRAARASSPRKIAPRSSGGS